MSIQDFLERGANPKAGYANLLLGQIFHKIVWKWSKLSPRVRDQNLSAYWLNKLWPCTSETDFTSYLKLL